MPRPVPHDDVTARNLNRAQMRVWCAQQVRGESPTHVVAHAFDLTGQLDEPALERAVARLAQRQPALRSSIVMHGQQPRLRPGSRDTAIPLERVRLEPGANLEAAIAQRLREPFSLAEPPLCRVSLVLADGATPVLLIATHRLVCDELSSQALRHELTSLYAEEAGVSGPRALPTSRTHHPKPVIASAPTAGLGFWRDLLTPLPSDLDLPVDHPRPPLRTGVGATVSREVVVQPLWSSDRPLARTVVATWGLLLSRYTGQDDLVVGTTLASGSVQTIDCSLNPLPLRLSLGRDQTCAELLAALDERWEQAASHAETPFDDIVREVAPPRDPSRTPLFSTLVIAEPSAELLDRPDAVDPLGARARVLPSTPALTDLTLRVSESGGRVTLALTVDRALFDDASAQAMLDQLVTGLEALGEHLDRPSAELPFTNATEAQRLRALNRTAQDVPTGTLVDKLRETALVRGTAPAIHDAQGSLSYRELFEAVQRVARSLREQGIGRGDRVGVCLPRDRDLVIAALGILACAAGYVPLDPLYPEDRLAHMVVDSGLKVAICDAQTGAVLPEETPRLQLSSLPESPASIDLEPPGPEDVAYVIYTSGSTGRPKGVLVPHRAVTNFLHAMAQRPGLTSDDTLVAVTTLSFDISVLELFLPLAVGAQVVVASSEDAMQVDRLSTLMQRHRATVLQATPTTWRMLLEHGHPFKAGFKALCGGEPLPSDLARGLVDADVELWNMYGPTETTVWSSCDRVDDPTRITIGRPIANTSFYVLDESGRRLPAGAPGELYIGGLGVTLGYHERPELVAERYVTDPFGEAPGQRMYRTGDRVRLLPDGRYEHQGRLDGQVKLRGFRIELGEIESTIRTLGLADDCAVAVRERAPGDRRLVAFVPAGTESDLSTMRRRLAQRLPAYMLPHHLVEVEALPRTPNGKLDRKRVAQLPVAWAVMTSADRVAPTTPTEAYVVRAFARQLGLAEVGIDDDFFALGGHSLLAVKVTLDLRDTFGVDFPLGLLFEHRTPRAVAWRIETAESSEPRPILLAGDDERPSLFLVCGVRIYEHFAQQLRHDYSVYGMYVPAEARMLEVDGRAPTVPELAADYIALLKAHQPQGPYRLGGVSFGGLVAYEIARQLVEAGEQVEHLLLLDTVLPKVGVRKYITLARRMLGLSREHALQSIRSRVRSRLSPRGSTSTIAKADVGDLNALRRAAYNEATMHHLTKIRPYAGRVTLVTAGERLDGDPLLDPLCGWGHLLRNPLVCPVDGDHLGILEGEAAVATADVFRAGEKRRFRPL